MYIANCPFNKIKILCPVMIGLEKSFRMMYSNLCLNSCETVPLMPSLTLHLDILNPGDGAGEDEETAHLSGLLLQRRV